MSDKDYLLSPQQLLAVYDKTVTATAIHVTEDAIIQAANDAMLKIWGKERSSVIGKSLADALPELKGQPFVDMFKRAWNEGITLSGKNTAADLKIDGEIKTFYFDFEYRAIKNNEGRTLCILHTAVDITERYLKYEAEEKAREKEQALAREQVLNEELAATNEELSATNEELQQAQEDLRLLNVELEARVAARLNELVESEKRFRTMAEGTDIFISVGDETGKAIYFNKAWTTLTGRLTKDLVNFGWIDLIHPDDKDGYVQTYLSALEKQQAFSSEFRILSKDGDYHWLLAQGPPRFNADGSFVGYISSCVDITERKLSEIEKQNLNTLIDASSEFIGLINLNFEIKYLNPAALGKLGWKSIKEKSIIDCIYPKDRAFVKSVLPKILEGKFKQEIRFWNEETKKPFWIEWNSFSIKDEQNNVVIATVSPDITERKLYQEELQDINMEMAAANEELITTNEELALTHDDLVAYSAKLTDSEEKLRLAIETGKMGTWSVNPVTLNVYVSSFVKEQMGLSASGEVLMSDIMQAIDPDYHQMLFSTFDNALKYHLPTDTEYPIKNRITGEEKWVKVTGSMFLDQNDKPIEYAGLFMDITERKLDELRKNDFIGMVSHELKTPLTAINGFVQVLQRKAKKDEDSYATIALEKTHSQIRKMTAMINGFLNVSRLESGKLSIEKKPFSLGGLINETIEETYISQSSHHIVVNQTCDIEITADRDKIGNVLSNLLSNGIKYSDNGTTISIDCALHDDYVEVKIKDQGIGIKEKDIDKLFERYYRVQGDHTISGFGIGLYLCAEIIERHNGKIWVESEVGKGSTFHFTLPLS